MLEETKSLSGPHGQIYLVPLLSAAWQPLPFLFSFPKCSALLFAREQKIAFPQPLLLCVSKAASNLLRFAPKHRTVCAGKACWLSKNSPLKIVVTLITA